ncbi:MAG: DUF86 domain-containing protein [Proteobacteria bacterium]|nr:DUF86 domain-containing protein [Pseudomonadota bacterium]
MVAPNKTLILEKLDTVARCLERVRDKSPATLQELSVDLDRQDIIILNLERAIQACVDIATHFTSHTPLPVPVTMADSFEVLASAGVITRQTADRMKKAVGLRNILVHEYQKIDWSILWSVITNHISDFQIFAQEVQTAVR